MLKPFRLLILGLLPLMVACPGPLEPGYNPNNLPDQGSLGFAYVGENAAVAGQWRIRWGIDRSPAVTAPTRIRFQGPGILVDPQTMIPLDLTKEYGGAGGAYLPPAEVPPEGAIAKVGCEVFSPFTKRWEKSPDYEIRVTRKTTPMDFLYGIEFGGDANSATIKAGNTLVFGMTVRPRPAADLQMQSTLVPPQGFMGDAGAFIVEPVDDTAWRYTYTAPATVVSPMDVIIRTSAFDPWVQQTRTIEFTLHVVPN
ncbi:MAG: hypothetical protein Q8K67_12950 [Geothrix sp.]|nr:hypothetical protein [Geothrix sp.]